jgi:hypothetical protein
MLSNWQSSVSGPAGILQPVRGPRSGVGSLNCGAPLQDQPAPLIQNDSGLRQDSPPALWHVEREVARLEVSKAHSSNLLMTSLAPREGLSWDTLSGGSI